jgi:DNA repair protein RadC
VVDVKVLDHLVVDYSAAMSFAERGFSNSAERLARH